MTGLEIALLTLLVIYSVLLIALCMTLKRYMKRAKEVDRWKETANLYSNMYAESAEILADLVVNGVDFDEK